MIYFIVQGLLSKVKCDPLSKNSNNLHNSGFKKIPIEIHWVNNACYKNNFVQIFNPSVNHETKFKSR